MNRVPSMPTPTLPIESALPQLAQALRTHVCVVLIAEPGAGKTTRVPLFLLDEPWLANRRILMLEPRRLAARAAAHYMASCLREAVGETVGYRVRQETRVGPSTRIEVITEGVLTRMLQSDPTLEGVGLVIFDEFHERSLHADLGLALCLDSQQILREELRLLVMSATLAAEPVAGLLGGAPVIRSEGRNYPVTTRYVGRKGGDRIESAVDRAVRAALDETKGDILVFLPGAGEIRRAADALSDLKEPGVRIASLHGGLSHEAQDMAMAPCPKGTRKVVLATSIAETSLTVEGVSVVIDSGLMRVPRFSPRTGMTRLETVRVSKASADQRRGRAGRLGPGVCYRLWTQQEETHLVAHTKPEILEADLAPLALELGQWGASDAGELRWLDAPPTAALSQARQLLVMLGALTERGGITAHGRRMAELGIHPRLAHMILTAIPLGLGAAACELAAFLDARDILRGDGGAPDADVRLRLAAIRNGHRSARATGVSERGDRVDWEAVRRIRTESQQLMKRVGVRDRSSDGAGDIDPCGLLLAFAFPDRIAGRRENGRFLLRNGRGAAFFPSQPLSGEPYVVAALLDDKGADSRVLLAAPVALADLERHLGDQIVSEEVVAWDAGAQAVKAKRRGRLGALVLREEPLSDPDPQSVLDALIEGIRDEGLELLPWTKAVRQLQQRLLFMHRLYPEWPDVSDAALHANLGEWLASYLHGMAKASELQRLNLRAILQGALSWDQRRELDECAPTHVEVPSGSRIPIDYRDPSAPALAVRLQEVFGLPETPRIARGRVPLRLHLLSPALRPVQVTQDLSSFWRDAYFEVRKELKGRYPKHRWPDDPLRGR